MINRKIESTCRLTIDDNAAMREISPAGIVELAVTRYQSENFAAVPEKNEKGGTWA